MNLRKNDLLKFAHAVLVAETNRAKIAEKQEKSFEEAIKGQKFRHPDTGNDVSFGSLPAEEQKKIRAEFNKSNSKEELSKDDQKALDALDDLDLDSDDLAKMLEEASKALEDFELSEEDLKELNDMDLDDLMGQAEAMLENNEGAGEELSKLIEEYEDDDDDDDDDDSTGLDKLLNKETKLDKKSQAHYDDIENLVLSEAISEDTLKDLVENLLGDAKSDDFEEVLDTGLDGLDSDQLMKLMKEVFSQDKEVAGELSRELQDMAVENLVESGDYPTDNDIGKEISSILGDLEDIMDGENLSDKDMSLDELKEIKKRYDLAKKKIKDEYKKTRESLMEKLGDNEELVDQALRDLGLNQDIDLDDDDWVEVELADYDVLLGEDFDDLLKEKTKEEKSKADKAKAEEAKAKAEKAQAEKAKAKAEKDKADRAEKSKANKAKRESINKSKEDRAKAQSDAVGQIDDLLGKYTEGGYATWDDFINFTTESHKNLFNAYGIETDKDLDDLSDEALEDFINAMDEVDEQSVQKLKAFNKKKDERASEIEKRNDVLVKEIRSLEDKTNDLAEKLYDGQEKVEKLRGKKSLTKEEKEELSKLEESLDSDAEKLQKMENDLNALVKEDYESSEEYEGLVAPSGRYIETFLNGRYGDQMSSPISSDNPTRTFERALNLQEDRKRQKELEDAKKKAEEEYKQMVKDYTKKIGDLTSNAQSAKSSDKVNELWGELGRIKGQLKSSEVLGEVQGDLDKAEKALEDAQERNSFSGKLKSFFGLGKKASQAQKDKVAKIALDMLKEEIALYKEEEANRKR